MSKFLVLERIEVQKLMREKSKKISDLDKLELKSLQKPIIKPNLPKNQLKIASK